MNLVVTFSRAILSPQSLRVLSQCIAACVVVGCVHMPLGHESAPEGPQPADGVYVTVLLSRATAVDSITRLLARHGYVIDYQSAQRLRSKPKLLGADTTMIVEAYIIPADADAPRTAVALAGTFSIGGMGIRDARVRNDPAVPRRMWAELQMLETALRRLPVASP